jgi:hypothetical protein
MKKRALYTIALKPARSQVLKVFVVLLFGKMGNKLYGFMQGNLDNLPKLNFFMIAIFFSKNDGFFSGGDPRCK